MLPWISRQWHSTRWKHQAPAMHTLQFSTHVLKEHQEKHGPSSFNIPQVHYDHELQSGHLDLFQLAPAPEPDGLTQPRARASSWNVLRWWLELAYWTRDKKITKKHWHKKTENPTEKRKECFPYHLGTSIFAGSDSIRRSSCRFHIRDFLGICRCQWSPSHCRESAHVPSTSTPSAHLHARQGGAVECIWWGFWWRWSRWPNSRWLFKSWGWFCLSNCISPSLLVGTSSGTWTSCIGITARSRHQYWCGCICLPFGQQAWPHLEDVVCHIFLLRCVQLCKLAQHKVARFHQGRGMGQNDLPVIIPLPKLVFLGPHFPLPWHGSSHSSDLHDLHQCGSTPLGFPLPIGWTSKGPGPIHSTFLSLECLGLAQPCWGVWTHTTYLLECNLPQMAAEN